MKGVGCELGKEVNGRKGGGGKIKERRERRFSVHG